MNRLSDSMVWNVSAQRTHGDLVTATNLDKKCNTKTEKKEIHCSCRMWATRHSGSQVMVGKPPSCPRCSMRSHPLTWIFQKYLQHLWLPERLRYHPEWEDHRRGGHPSARNWTRSSHSTRSRSLAWRIRQSAYKYFPHVRMPWLPQYVHGHVDVPAQQCEL